MKVFACQVGNFRTFMVYHEKRINNLLGVFVSDTSIVIKVN